MSNESNETSGREQSTSDIIADNATSDATTEQAPSNTEPDGGDFDTYEDFGSGDLSDRRHRDWSQSTSGNGYDNAMTD
jgi:hypothetical protein